MAEAYEINGKFVSEEEYNAFVAKNSTLASAADLASAAKIANAPILGEPSIPPMSGFLGGAPSVNPINQSSNKGPLPPNFQSIINGPVRNLGGISPGAEKQIVNPVSSANITALNGTSSTMETDLRVRIRVPNDYLTKFTSGTSNGSELSALGGIIFPYTPQISFEHKAEYSSQTPTHSNYAIHFYKNSSVGDISITGKFTVQNEKDAIVYLSTIHLLKALTKMRFGGPSAPSAGGGRGTPVNYSDSDSGAPPPVCRLDAYGDFMLKNVPVVITSFRTDWPDSIDFYTLSGNSKNSPFNQTSVPILSTIAISCKPVYSRAEMQAMSVTKYLNDDFYSRQGYL
jgi:hypothetical protein